MNLIKYLAGNIPFLGVPYRYVRAISSQILPVRTTYAQTGEDTIAIEILQSLKLNAPIFYVDIGANHPSRISNTYRLYREGASGITIDANDELVRLHRAVRPRDIQLAVGCGSQNGLMKFYYSKTPVLSSFAASQVESLWKTRYLPVFTLDRICSDLDVKRIDFLSVDVEGRDLDVLRGATEALKMTRLLCVEANTEAEGDQIKKFMVQQKFELRVANGWNLFFVNTIFKS